MSLSTSFSIPHLNNDMNEFFIYKCNNGRKLNNWAHFDWGKKLNIINVCAFGETSIEELKSSKPAEFISQSHNVPSEYFSWKILILQVHQQSVCSFCLSHTYPLFAFNWFTRRLVQWQQKFMHFTWLFVSGRRSGQRLCCFFLSGFLPFLPKLTPDAKDLRFIGDIKLRNLIGLASTLIPGNHNKLSRTGQPLLALNLLTDRNLYLHRTVPHIRNIALKGAIKLSLNRIEEINLINCSSSNYKR